MLQTCNADGVIGLQMFMFGTSALEQFMDRVIEWPRYCNYILQISHLRGTHLEMVSVIERALAKISSSQNEPNVGNLLSAEQHVSGSSSMEGIEVTLSHKLEERGTHLGWRL
jgi:CCR4-NOT transcription complex subunit 1